MYSTQSHPQPPAFTTTGRVVEHPLQTYLILPDDTDVYLEHKSFLEDRLKEARAIRTYYTTLSDRVISGTLNDKELDALSTTIRLTALPSLESSLNWARAEEAESKAYLEWAPHEDIRGGRWVPEGHSLYPCGPVQNLKKFDPKKPLTKEEIDEHLKRGPGSGLTIMTATQILWLAKDIRRDLEKAYDAALMLRALAKAGTVILTSAARQGPGVLKPSERQELRKPTQTTIGRTDDKSSAKDNNTGIPSKSKTDVAKRDTSQTKGAAQAKDKALPSIPAADQKKEKGSGAPQQAHSSNSKVRQDDSAMHASKMNAPDQCRETSKKEDGKGCR